MLWLYWLLSHMSKAVIIFTDYLAIVKIYFLFVFVLIIKILIVNFLVMNLTLLLVIQSIILMKMFFLTALQPLCLFERIKLIIVKSWNICKSICRKIIIVLIITARFSIIHKICSLRLNNV